MQRALEADLVEKPRWIPGQVFDQAHDGQRLQAGQLGVDRLAGERRGRRPRRWRSCPRGCRRRRKVEQADVLGVHGQTIQSSSFKPGLFKVAGVVGDQDQGFGHRVGGNLRVQFANRRALARPMP